MITMTTTVNSGRDALTLQGLRDFVDAAERKGIPLTTKVQRENPYEAGTYNYNVHGLQVTLTVTEPLTTTPQDAV